jgi:hypothetical protein
MPVTSMRDLAGGGRQLPAAGLRADGGQADDAPAFPAVMASLRVPRRRGGLRVRSDAVLVDEAYSSRGIRTHLQCAAQRARMRIRKFGLSFSQ